MRTCIECGVAFDASPQARTCSDACRKQRKAAYDYRRYRENREEFAAYHRKRCEENREKKREYDRGYRERTRESRLAEKREYGKTYYRRPEVKLRARLYAHQRRAWRQANGEYTVSVTDVERLIRRFQGRCAYCCDGPAQALDHVVPLSRGGSHGVGNLLPACTPCNSMKSHRTIMEWRLGKAVPRKM